MLKVIKLPVSLIISYAAGAIGSLATFPNISTWYATLEKPFFSPPNWLFGPVWTTLYTLIGISLWLVWTAQYRKDKRPAYTIFAVQLGLNALWSLVFFGSHAPWMGFVVIVAMLIAIVATAQKFWPISKIGAYLLIPYIAWVGFATMLNLAVALLN